MKFLKKLLFIFMLLIIVVLGAFVYFMINFDSYKAKMAERIELKLDKVTVASTNFSKIKLHFIVNNHLFFGVIFKNLLFDMNIGGSKVAKGMQAESSVTLNPNVDTNVVISCDVDPITAKRAIGKSVEENAGKLLKALLSHKSVKKELGDDIKGITQITGTAILMIKIGSMEVPFQKKVSF